MSYLKVEGLSKFFGGLRAVHDVSFEVEHRLQFPYDHFDPRIIKC